ncbi:hypothetical protein AVEN_187141-1 [Araneus ventricosus]|uniref:Uncharacterized protein n=1 Tax=Araneus ventricosus TaxID=182803 RepID=A0A4Y2VFC7_ARAVE|nr:hypothetical protein AVEN_187141-1 [Araneus ventricosus]
MVTSELSLTCCKLTASLHSCHDKFVASLFQTKIVIWETCFTRRVVDYAILPFRRIAANLSRQVCHDKIISRKIKLAANVHVIWELHWGRTEPGAVLFRSVMPQVQRLTKSYCKARLEIKELQYKYMNEQSKE